MAHRSTDFRSLRNPAVIQAMSYISHHACKGIKIEQVLDAVGMSRSNLEKRFKDDIGQTIHGVIHEDTLDRACNLLAANSFIINRISKMCGYRTLQYFYSVFKKGYAITPKEHRDKYGEVSY